MSKSGRHVFSSGAGLAAIFKSERWVLGGEVKVTFLVQPHQQRQSGESETENRDRCKSSGSLSMNNTDCCNCSFTAEPFFCFWESTSWSFTDINCRHNVHLFYIRQEAQTCKFATLISGHIWILLTKMYHFNLRYYLSFFLQICMLHFREYLNFILVNLPL